VPTFINGYINKNSVEDDWDYLRLGQDPSKYDYAELEMGLSNPSSARSFSFDKMDYKFISFNLFVSLHRKTLSRETY
jgi:hypothetical protein